MRKYVWALLALAGQFALARNSIATARLDWFHAAGTFHSLGDSQTGDSWVEKIGNTRYQFQEVTRNAEYVEIKDDTRGCRVRLYKNRAEVKFASEVDFHPIYNGAWDTRRTFHTLQNPGGRPYFRQIENDDWWYMPAGTNGPVRFSTIERTNDKVVIQGNGRKYWLFDTSVEFQDGNGPTEIFFFEGYWDERSPN